MNTDEKPYAFCLHTVTYPDQKPGFFKKPGFYCRKRMK